MAIQSVDTLFRDYATAGVPASGAHEPVKADLRDTFRDIAPANYIITRTGTRTGSYSRSVASRDGKYVLLSDFGVSPGSTSDARNALLDALEACEDGGIPTLIIDGRYVVEDYVPITAPIRIIGANRGLDRLHIGMTGRTRPGIQILSSDVVIEDLEILADDSGGTPGEYTGAYGTCISIGDFRPAAAIAEVTGTHLARLRLGRAAGSRTCHALAIMGRTNGLVATDLDFLGDGTAKHNYAVLMHWEARSSVDGDALQPIIGNSFHPLNIQMQRLRVRNCIHGLVVSSAGYVDVRDVDMDGVGWALTTLVGDEGTAYAPAAQAPAIMKGLNFQGFNIRNATMSVSDGQDGIIEIGGVGTSKLDNHPVHGQKWRYQLDYDIAISDVTLHAAASVDYHTTIRNVAGRVRLSNIHAPGVGTVGGALISNSRADIDIRKVTDAARLEIIASPDVTVDGARATGAVATTTNRGVVVSGRYQAMTLAADVASGATTITVTPALPYPLDVGDVLEIGTSIRVRVSTYVPSAVTAIPVVALPTSATSGTAVIVRQQCDRLLVANGTYDQHYRAFELLDAPGYKLIDNLITRYGVYGIEVGRTAASGAAPAGDCYGQIAGNVIREGGQQRVADGSTATRDIIVTAGAGAKIDDNELAVSAPGVSSAVVVSAGAGEGRVANNRIGSTVGAPIVVSVAPDVVHCVGNVSTAGANVDPRLTWSPEVQIGGSSAGMTQSVSLAWYQLADDLMYYGADITVSNIGSGTGAVTIAGLPYPADQTQGTQQPAGELKVIGGTSVSYEAFVVPATDGAYLRCQRNTATSVTDLLHSNMVNGIRFRVNGELLISV